MCSFGTGSTQRLNWAKIVQPVCKVNWNLWFCFISWINHFAYRIVSYRSLCFFLLLLLRSIRSMLAYWSVSRLSLSVAAIFYAQSSFDSAETFVIAACSLFFIGLIPNFIIKLIRTENTWTENFEVLFPFHQFARWWVGWLVRSFECDKMAGKGEFFQQN